MSRSLSGRYSDTKGDADQEKPANNDRTLDVVRPVAAGRGKNHGKAKNGEGHGPNNPHSVSPVAGHAPPNAEQKTDGDPSDETAGPIRFGFPLPLGHTFCSPSSTRDWRDRTGSRPDDARQLARFQRHVLSRWYPEVRPTGVMDVTTRLAVTRVQHARRIPQTGRLDEATWNYAQEHVPEG